MPFGMLLTQCADFYSSEQIQAAKDLFWETAVSVSPDLSARKDMRIEEYQAEGHWHSEKAKTGHGGPDQGNSGM